MAEINLSRSVRFVSLDTHPANNSLVITYEILVIASDQASGSEVSRRSKRDQLQINVSALDGLAKGDLRQQASDGVAIFSPLNLRKLSEEILKKCPMLVNSGDPMRALEDVQLNLLYLMNRKQAQLSQPSMPSRPPSSASLKSGSPSLGRLASARSGSARLRATTTTTTRGDLVSQRLQTPSNPLDFYAQSCERHSEMKARRVDSFQELLDEFSLQMDAHLERREQVEALLTDRVSKSDLENLDTHLEGLYGDQDERKRSIANVRRFIKQNNERLLSASTNRLLVCAMLRTLRDYEGAKDQFVSESILYCLVKFTTYEDLLERMFSSNSGEWLDLVKVVIDLLERHTRALNSTTQLNDLTQVVASFYYTNSLLILMSNLMGLNKLIAILIQQHGDKVADVLINLFSLLAKYLARDTRVSTNRYECLTVTLGLCTGTAQQLIVFKEFVMILRAKNRPRALVNSLTSLLSILQLCRPGSGTSGQQQQQQQQHQLIISDQETLLEIYQLELELLKLITTLTYDVRLKARFMRKSLLLKCVLRNLVLFLAASRKSSTLSPYDCSPVLMVPLRCLYELSCGEKIKHELFRSRIIMKCLLEYLLSSAADLTAELERTQRSMRVSENKPLASYSSSSRLDLNEEDQIVLVPQKADHFIVSIWLNLSARSEAPIYHLSSGNEELREPLCDYIQLIANQLDALMQLVSASTDRAPTRAMHLGVYIHTKLVRNLSQFVEFSPGEALLQTLANACQMLLSLPARQLREFLPLAVEILAALAKFITRSTAVDNDENETSKSRDERTIKDSPVDYLGAVFKQLFHHSHPALLSRSSVAEGENDDFLMASILFVGALAQQREICSGIESIQGELLSSISATLELKQTDTEMLISCLFTLRQLMNHAAFLRYFGQALEESLEQGDQNALMLVEALSLLVTHPDLSVVKLANSILNMLKQFEELYSLSAESMACQCRFSAYNSKWLEAIRASRDEPRDDLLERPSSMTATTTATTMTRQQQTFSGPEMDLYAGLQGDIESADAHMDLDLDYNQLRTISEMEVHSSSSSSRLSTTSSLGATNPTRENHQRKLRPGNNDAAAASASAADEQSDHEEDEDEEEDEEETSSEPDLNVIDANSMIKHLTSRREYRSELLRR